MRLSQYIRVAFVYPTFFAIGIYATILTCTLLLTEAVDTSAGARLALVRHHRQATLKWLQRLLRGLGLGFWLVAVLSLLGIRDALVSIMGWALALPIGPTSSLKVGTVLSVILIFGGGYLVASAVRYVLREEILCPLNMPRGIPELVASSTFCEYWWYSSCRPRASARLSGRSSRC